MLSIFKQYKGWLSFLVIFAFISNGLALIIPKLISKYIDEYQAVTGQGLIYNANWPAIIIGSIAILVLVTTIVQFVFSTYLSEKIAFDMRAKLIGSLKKQSYAFISDSTPSKLLTNLTSDIDAVKNAASQGIVSMFSAGLTFIGVLILLLLTNWKMALLTFTIIPFIVVTFALVFGKLGALFKSGQENIEKIFKVINESIIAAPLVRVLNAGKSEMRKFDVVNEKAKGIGMQTLYYFAALIPVIMLLANAATLIILWFGGKYVVEGTMTLGELSAFFAYSSMFIWPIFILSFTGTLFSRANVSMGRINAIMNAEVAHEDGKHIAKIKGVVEFKNVHLELGNRTILQDVSFAIKPKTRNAIVGPTAAGKTQLFYLLAGLIKQNSGSITIDGVPLKEWDHDSYLGQIGLVFQDSIIFNTSLRENVDFRMSGDEEAVRKALKTAELGDLLASLPKGLDSKLNERGTNLSGGQKQRLMLARALAQNPQVLLLDDFTARVDIDTEQKIIANIRTDYPDLTLISITQKIDPIKDYDQVIVLMEGEILDVGKHEELLNRSIEYKQIYQSQQKAH